MHPIDSEPSVMAPQDETQEISEEPATALLSEPPAGVDSEPIPADEPAREAERTSEPADEAPLLVEPDVPVVQDQPEAPVEEAVPEAPEDEPFVLTALEAPAVELAHRQDNSDQWKAILEAIIYVSDEPLSAAQIANALQLPQERITALLAELMADYAEAKHGIVIREVANGYKMGTKPEHHDAIRTFVRNLKPPLKLSMAALETLAVIAYKQPITAPEILDIRGVQGGGVLKTLLDRKLITTAGRKSVVGKPILYRTTKEFLIQFGLKDISELPTLKEFEELRRLALSEPELEPEPQAAMAAEPETVSQQEQGQVHDA
jgi:segregation and condensation protein B